VLNTSCASRTYLYYPSTSKCGYICITSISTNKLLKILNSIKIFNKIKKVVNKI